MKTFLRNLKIVLILFSVLSVLVLAGLVVQLHRSQTQLQVAAGESKSALRDRYAQAGTIHASDGAVLAHSFDSDRHYSEDAELARAHLHLIGDYTHYIDQTVESGYQRSLLGTDRSFLHQFWLDLRGQGLRGDDLVLTVDSELSRLAYQQIGARKGAIVVMDYTTGAILTAVSRPSALPSEVIGWQEIEDSALFNRVLKGQYHPGSFFKTVTAAAYLQANGDPDFSLDCQGESTVSPYGADEAGDGHGWVDLETAFAASCNVYFGELGARLGAERLENMAAELGLSQPLPMGRIQSGAARARCPDDDRLASWFAIGQPVGDSELVMTPLHMVVSIGAIAHEGQAVMPQVIGHRIDPVGREHGLLEPQASPDHSIDASLAANLDILLRQAVTQGTGQAAAIAGYPVAGKTGTVQIEGRDSTALFVGYIADDSMPLAIAVVLEEGGSGGQAAAPVASQVLAAAARLDRLP